MQRIKLIFLKIGFAFVSVFQFISHGGNSKKIALGASILMLSASIQSCGNNNKPKDEEPPKNDSDIITCYAAPDSAFVDDTVKSAPEVQQQVTPSSKDTNKVDDRIMCYKPTLSKNSTH